LKYWSSSGAGDDLDVPCYLCLSDGADAISFRALDVSNSALCKNYRATMRGPFLLPAELIARRLFCTLANLQHSLFSNESSPAAAALNNNHTSALYNFMNSQKMR